jgi:hypothetical protein
VLTSFAGLRRAACDVLWQFPIVDAPHPALCPAYAFVLTSRTSTSYLCSSPWLPITEEGHTQLLGGTKVSGGAKRIAMAAHSYPPPVDNPLA